MQNVLKWVCHNFSLLKNFAVMFLVDKILVETIVNVSHSILLMEKFFGLDTGLAIPWEQDIKIFHLRPAFFSHSIHDSPPMMTFFGFTCGIKLFYCLK